MGVIETILFITAPLPIKILFVIAWLYSTYYAIGLHRLKNNEKNKNNKGNE